MLEAANDLLFGLVSASIIYGIPAVVIGVPASIIIAVVGANIARR